MATSKSAAEAAETEATTSKRSSAKVASGKVVKYVGMSDVRTIDAASWRSIGVEDQAKVTWDKSNGYSVMAADLTEAALRYLDEDDAGFVVADAEA